MGGADDGAVECHLIYVFIRGEDVGITDTLYVCGG